MRKHPNKKRRVVSKKNNNEGKEKMNKRKTEKIQLLIKKIIELEEKLIPTEGNRVKFRLQQAEIAKSLKDEKIPGGVTSHLQKFLSRSSIRTIQRYQRMVVKVDIEKYPVLCKLGTNRLEDLLSKEKDTAAEILKRENISIPKNSKDEDALKEFIDAVDYYIDEKKGGESIPTEPEEKSTQNRSTKKKSTSMEGVSPIINMMEKHTDTKPAKDPAEMDISELRKKYPKRIKIISAWSKAVIKKEVYSNFNDKTLSRLKTLNRRLSYIIEYMEGE